MTRLDPVPAERLGLGTRFWLWVVRRVYGRMPRAYPIIAHAPRAVPGMLLVNAMFGTGRSALDRDLLTLVPLRVAELIGCHF